MNVESNMSNMWIPKDEIYNAYQNFCNIDLKLNNTIKQIEILKNEGDEHGIIIDEHNHSELIKSFDSNLIILSSRRTTQLIFLEQEKKNLTEEFNSLDKTNIIENYENYVKEAYNFLSKNNLYKIINIEDILCKEKLNNLVHKTCFNLTITPQIGFGYIFNVDYRQEDLYKYVIIDKYFGIKKYFNEDLNRYNLIATKVASEVASKVAKIEKDIKDIDKLKNLRRDINKFKSLQEIEEIEDILYYKKHLVLNNITLLQEIDDFVILQNTSGIKQYRSLKEIKDLVN